MRRISAGAKITSAKIAKEIVRGVRVVRGVARCSEVCAKL